MERSKFTIYFLLSGLMLFLSSVSFAQDDEELEVRKTSTGHAMGETLLYKSSEANALAVTNKHGNIVIDTWNKDSIKVVYEINVGTFDEDLAKEVLEKISVNKYVSGKKLHLKTLFEEDFQSSFTFSINYHIHVPPAVKAEITSNFGDIYINGLQDYAQIKADYGRLFIKNDSTRLKTARMHLSFMEGDIAKTDTVNFFLSNCTMTLHNIEKVSGITNFSALNADSVNTVKLKTNLDRITLNGIDSISITGEKTFCNISDLRQTGHFELNTGGLNLSVANSLKSLTVANEKANIELTVPTGMQYLLHGEIKQGKLSHYNQNALDIMKDVDTITFSGEFGSNANTNITLFNSGANLVIKQK